MRNTDKFQETVKASSQQDAPEQIVQVTCTCAVRPARPWHPHVDTLLLAVRAAPLLDRDASVQTARGRSSHVGARHIKTRM